jgi:hypothetical protein
MPDTVNAMRRTLPIVLLVALLVPAGALATRVTPGDGTLSVRNGDGNIELKNLRGAVIGLVAQGRIEVESPKDDDCGALNVWGAEREFETSKFKQREFDFITICVFAGKDIRFRLVGQQTTVRLQGKDISLSAVGRAAAFLKGKGGAADGTYSVNSGEYASLPDDGRRFLLGAQPLPLSLE